MRFILRILCVSSVLTQWWVKEHHTATYYDGGVVDHEDEICQDARIRGLVQLALEGRFQDRCIAEGAKDSTWESS